MMKHVLLVLLFGISLSSFSGHTQDKPTGHKHGSSAIGIHGMAIFQHEGAFYASHMPLARSMHAHQVVFSFKLNSQDSGKLNTLSQQFSLLSMKPERFDLLKLMDGSLTHFQADVYGNHFERGGKIKLKNVSVEVSKMLLIKSLSPNVSNGHYYLVPTADNKGILIHRIGDSPSFDQILAANVSTGQSSLLKASTLINLTDGKPITLPFSNNKKITVTRQLYLETKDFE